MNEIIRVLQDADGALERAVSAPWPALDDSTLVSVVRIAEQLGRRLDAVRSASAAQVEERSRREIGDAALSRRFG